MIDSSVSGKNERQSTMNIPSSVYDLINNSNARNLSGALRKLYGSPKNGNSRKAFIDKKNRIVIKLPILDGYSKYNEQEYANYLAYQQGKSKIPVATCTILYTTDYVAVIVMEIVKPITIIRRSELPEWALYGGTDSYQIGYTDSGDIVAFDHTKGV